jgi:hypothetical protein
VALYTQCEGEGGTAAQAYERFRFELGNRPELEDFWQQMAETDRNGHAAMPPPSVGGEESTELGKGTLLLEALIATIKAPRK